MTDFVWAPCAHCGGGLFECACCGTHQPGARRPVWTGPKPDAPDTNPRCPNCSAVMFYTAAARSRLICPVCEWDHDQPAASDPVDHPAHYAHPSGVECITITRHMGFNLGNAIKYIWRADAKGNAVQDLEKAIWYLRDELARRGGGQS